MLKAIDNLSPPITLFYKGYERHSSSISGCLTIITYLVIVILGIFFSMDFILKRNPTSFFYNRFIYDIGTFSFNNTGIFHFIVTGEQTNEEYDDKVFMVIGTNEENEKINENTNIILYDHWIYHPCNYIQIGKLKEYLDEYNTSFSKGLCITQFYNKTTKTIINYNDKDFKYPILEHGNSNINGNTYGIYLLRCQNHSELKKNDCYPKDIADQKGIDAYSFGIYFIDQYVDVTNYNHPIKRFYNKIRNQIILSSYTINHLNLKPLKLTTHSGIIFNSNSEINSFYFDVYEKFTYNEEETGIYGAFYFWMQNQMSIYDRTYQKIQDISASISGISKLLFIIGYFTNYLFAEITLIKNLSNDICRKMNKFGRKTNTRGFKALKILNYTQIINNSQFPIQLPNDNNNNNNFSFNSPNSQTQLNKNLFKKNSVPLKNNLINECNISKINLKEQSFPQKKIFKRKPKTCKILYVKLCCLKNTYINKLENIRMKVLSEEKLFTSYFVLGALSDIFLKRYLNESINYENKIDKKNKNIWSPHQNLFKISLK